MTTGKTEAGAAIATATLKGEDEASTGAAGTGAEVGGADGERTDGLTGFDATAADIIAGIGGPDNVRSVLHCITRVRFYLKDESLADDEAVADLDGVIDVAKAGGQYQVVIGPDVVDVYDAVVAQLPDVGAGEQDADVELVERPTTLWGWVKLGFSSLIGVITGSMIPVVGMLAASGILKGLLALLMQYEVVTEASNTYHFIDAMSSSMFFFLPIIIGFTAAKRLGAAPIVVAIIGGVLCYPSVVDMSKNTDDVITVGRTVFNSDFFGIPVSLPAGNAYAYSIFPIIVGAWLASKIEPWLKKTLPAVIRPIFGPLIEIFVVSALILLVFGPAVMLVSGGIAAVINAILSFNYTLAGLLIGGFYQCLVIFGLHWAVIPIISSELASPGYSHLNAIVSATMIAQGGGALAVWLRVRDARIKRMAAPATISAFCGVTEPAMYGLNLKYGRIFITASIGGAVGGLLTGLLNVNMWGFTGGFVGFPSFVNPDGMDSSPSPASGSPAPRPSWSPSCAPTSSASNRPTSTRNAPSRRYASATASPSPSSQYPGSTAQPGAPDGLVSSPPTDRWPGSVSDAAGPPARLCSSYTALHPPPRRPRLSALPAAGGRCPGRRSRPVNGASACTRRAHPSSRRSSRRPRRRNPFPPGG